jgi:hypothetical protein
MTHLTDDERAELLRLCEAAKDGLPYSGSDGYGPLIDDEKAEAMFEQLATALPRLLAELEELRASIAWAGQLNPSTNYESDGAIVHMTFEEFDAMRACLGIRPAHRSKEKSMTVSCRWFRQTVSERDAAIARAEKAEAELKEAQFAQDSTARRVAEGIAREAKLREALIVLNSAIDAFWNDEGRKPIVTSTGTRTDNPVTAIVSAQQAALAALKEGAAR